MTAQNGGIRISGGGVAPLQMPPRIQHALTERGTVLPFFLGFQHFLGNSPHFSVFVLPSALNLRPNDEKAEVVF